MNSDRFDLLLVGGRVVGPEGWLRSDVGVADGRITAMQPGLPAQGATQVLDVRGSYVTAGLIDLHVHSYWGVNPYGLDVDSICLASGVTTAVDAGSAGPVNFQGFRRFIAEPARTRLLAFVCVAQHGVLNGPRELEDLRFADPEGAAQAVTDNPAVAVGIKVRLNRETVGDHGRQALQLAVRSGELCQSPVMVHIGGTNISLEEIVETLRPGDIVTHCFTPKPPSIVDDGGRLRAGVRQAQERGVLFDVGHASGHFDFPLVRQALSDGFHPDTISTDLHGRANRALIVDLPTTMTKLLALGMPLEQVVAACTVNPARAIGWQDRLGTIAVGREADLAVLRVVEAPARLGDSTGHELVAERRIRAQWTIRQGEAFPSGDST